MSVILDDLIKIKKAVLINHQNPNSSEFRSAHNYLSKFKSSVSCLPICLDLSSYKEQDEIRHFAMQTICYVTNTYWLTFSEKQKNNLKDMCFTFLQRGSKGVMEEKDYLKEKIVDIVCTVALKELPSNWPKFFKILIEYSRNSEASLELVLKVLQNLRRETDINLKLNLRKRENIKQTLKSYNKEIYYLIENIFEIYLNRYQNSLNEQKILSEKIIVTGLNCLSANISFPLAGMFSKNLIDHICQMTKVPPFFVKAFECLILICNKKAVIPQGITVNIYKSKIYLIWKTTVEALDFLVRDKSDFDKTEHFELVLEISGLIIKNHKNITYRKENNLNLKYNFVILLTQIFSVKLEKPLISIFEIWKTMFEVKLFEDFEDFHKIKMGLFNTCFSNLEKLTELDENIDENKENLHTIIILLMKRILMNDKELFINNLLEKIKMLLSINYENFEDKKDKNGFCLKNSKLYNCWDNVFKVIGLLFFRECFSRYSFKNNKFPNSKKYCERILELILFSSNDPLLNVLVVRNVSRFHNLFYENENSFKVVLIHIISILKKFSIKNTSKIEKETLKNITLLRKTAVNSLIWISFKCKKLFVPIFDEIYKEIQNIIKESIEEDYIFGLQGMLLNISSNHSLKKKRKEIVINYFKEASEIFLSNDVSVFFDRGMVLELIKQTPKTNKIRKLIKRSLSALISLLRAATKAPITYINKNVKSIIRIRNIISFQFDEIWTILKSVLSAVSRLCEAINSLYSKTTEYQVDVEWISMLLIPPRMYFRNINNHKGRGLNNKKGNERLYNKGHSSLISIWLNDVRDCCYSLFSLSCNLSNSFFFSDALTLSNSLLNNINIIPLRNLKSIGEKIISPFVIRCTASSPQCLETFMTPFLANYFSVCCTRLTNSWERLSKSENLFPYSDFGETIDLEIELENELRLFTQAVSRLLFSFSISISLEDPFDNKNNQKNSNNKHSKGQNNYKTKKNYKNKQFYLNKAFFKYIFTSKLVLDPFCRLLLFFLKCPDNISRNNIYCLLHTLTKHLSSEKSVLEIMSKFVIEAIKIQSDLKEVDESLVNFVNLTLFSLSRLKPPVTKTILTTNIKTVPEEDIEFLTNAYRSKDRSLQKKKTKQFLLKISGEYGSEIFFEKKGTFTRRLSKKWRGKKTNSHFRTNYIKSMDLRMLFDNEEDDDENEEENEW